MSVLQFNDTTNLEGLVQMYERETGQQVGDVSGNATKLKQFTADCNRALDKVTAIGMRSSGTFQWDDANHTKYNIATTNLVSGQRDYSFSTDEQGNYILAISKVLVADSSGTFREVEPVDVQSQGNLLTFQTTQGGVPTRYDKTATGIFLDPIPNYNYASGLKIYIDRTASYFTTADTTKVAGIPAIFIEYLYLRPALDYARRTDRQMYNRILDEIIRYEGDEARNITGSIAAFFSRRPKDEKPRLIPNQENNK
jgi:hypothetical protein